MNLLIKIDLKNLRLMLWPVIGIFVCKIFDIVNTKVAFVIYLAIIVYLIFSLKKIVIPNIKGVGLYAFTIFYATIIGVFSYGSRSVARDLYYVLPTLALIILGYYLYIFNGSKTSIIKTLIVCGTIASSYTWMRLFTDYSISDQYERLKIILGQDSTEILFIFVILFFYMFIKREKLFNKFFEFYSFFIMLAQLALCMQRNIWVSLLVAFLCISVMAIKKEYRKRIIKLLIVTTILATVVISAFFAIAPEKMTKQIIDKNANIEKEINSDNEYNSIDDAMINWRGYEIQCAEEQWKKNSLFGQVFGTGIGTGVYLEFVPYTWGEITSTGEIPILHNGYYTMLNKTGIIGVIALIWFMLANVVTGYNLLKRREDMDIEAGILITISIVYLVQTYVARGPVIQDANIVWPLMVGWISAKNYRKHAAKIIDSEGEK